MNCGAQLDCGLANVLCFGGQAYIALLLSLYIRCSSRKDEAGSGLLEGHTARAVLSGVLLLVHLAEIGEVVAGQRAAWIGATAALSAWLSTQLFYFHVQRYDRPGYLSVSSLLYLMCGLSRGVQLYSLLEEVGFDFMAVNTAAASSTLCYAMALNDMATLFNEMKEGRSGDGRKAEGVSYRQEAVHWYSRLTFFWLVPLLKRGFRQPLELEDLGKLPATETAAHQFSSFSETFNRNKCGDKVVSLWRCYFQCYWKNFFIGGALKLLGDLVGFVAPLGIAVIIDYVAERQHLPTPYQGKYVRVVDFLRNGYNMAGIIFLSALAQSSFSQASSHVIAVEGIRLKTALQGLIYDKALRLSVSNKDEDSEGRVGSTTNLLSEDAFNIMTCFWIGHYTWAIPCKVAVLMYLLYRKLGVSAVAGAVFCIVFMTPLQFLIGKKMSTNSNTITAACDERLRMTNEMLQGIRLLKLCGWEEQFRARVSAAREKELECLDRDSLYWALMSFLTHSSTSLITLVTLAFYYYLEESTLSPSNVFSALALFNQLTVPLFIFPITVPIIISAIVSTRRLEDFLALQETISILPSLPRQCPLITTSGKPLHQLMKDGLYGLGGIQEEPDGTGDDSSIPSTDEKKASSVCIIREAGFSWGEQRIPTIWIDKVNIPKGKLTAVIGRVGSGKSSFLSALLGEMKSLSGLLKWEKGVCLAYVSQQPWLLNASLRENILMGLPYKEKRFSRVLTAAALQQDLEILPQKDFTEVGERGVNLSGGQRQRIAIARAFYSKANVVILDDPLSSLDYHVAQHVFEKGILTLVTRQKRTVIMVTHSLHLLRYADLVISLEGGKVRASGKLSELELMGEVVTSDESEQDTERTAKERWQLVRLVSRVGGQPVYSRQSKPLFIPFRKRVRSTSELFWTGELSLPARELPLGRASTLPRQVARASSLQPRPVNRQASVNHPLRSRTYTFDSGSQGRNILKQIFMSSTK